MTLEEAARQLDEELCVVEDGRVRCCVGLRATLYFWKGADPEVRKRLLRVFERCLKEADGRLPPSIGQESGSPRAQADLW